VASTIIAAHLVVFVTVVSHMAAMSVYTAVQEPAMYKIIAATLCVDFSQPKAHRLVEASQCCGVIIAARFQRAAEKETSQVAVAPV